MNIEGPVIASFVAAFVSIVGAVIAAWNARGLEKRKGEIARDAATHAAELRVASERQLGMFTQAARSTEEAARALLDWLGGMNHYQSQVMQSQDKTIVHTDHDARVLLAGNAEKAGILMPPMLDEPYTEARLAVRGAVEAITTHAQLRRAEDYKTQEARMQAARDAVAHFIHDVRKWKAEEWERLSGSAKLSKG